MHDGYNIRPGCVLVGRVASIIITAADAERVHGSLPRVMLAVMYSERKEKKDKKDTGSHGEDILDSVLQRELKVGWRRVQVKTIRAGSYSWLGVPCSLCGKLSDKYSVTLLVYVKDHIVGDRKTKILAAGFHSLRCYGALQAYYHCTLVMLLYMSVHRS